MTESLPVGYLCCDHIDDKLQILKVRDGISLTHPISTPNPIAIKQTPIDMYTMSNLVNKSCLLKVI